jgi:hypothetical protein
MMYDVSMIHYKMHDTWHDFSHDAWMEGFFLLKARSWVARIGLLELRTA